MEARVAALEQQLAAREAALAARIAALESQAAAGGQAASQPAVMRGAQLWGPQQGQQAEEQQAALHAQLESKQAEAVQSACGSRRGHEALPQGAATCTNTSAHFEQRR